MKFITNHVAKLAFLSVFAALSVYAEPTPTPHSESSPSPTPTPHSEPSASPTPTPHSDLSPTPTPHHEPTATPRPSSSPTPTPGDNDDHHGEVSLRGFYGSTTPAGSLIVFYVEKNTHVQIHLLDIAGQLLGFAEGALTNGSFALTLTTGQAVIGAANENGIAFTLAGQPFQASRFPMGNGSDIAGGYFGVAQGPTGESRVMFIIDASKHIIMIQRTGTVLSGGFGTITPPVAPATLSTFTLTSVIGSSSSITGSFTITDGVFTGAFQTSAGTYTVNTFKNSLFNRMANISTRGLVGTGQGQLIGGFIITGGPKLVMIRAIGPSLAALGVSPALANPSVQLFSGATLLGSNDDWKTNANAVQIMATGIPPTDDLESALLVRLEPGAYTTVVNGAGDSTGIALVEIYEIGFE